MQQPMRVVERVRSLGCRVSLGGMGKPEVSEPTVRQVAQITETECRLCGARVAGLNNRYACNLCGWVNHWSEGTSALPTASDDPDQQGAKPRRRRTP